MNNLTTTLPDSGTSPLVEAKTDVALLGIGTAVPPHARQSQLADGVTQMCCTTDEQKAWLQRVFLRTGVLRRGSVVLDSEDDVSAIEKFFPPPSSSNPLGPSTAVRMRRYAAEAPPLGASAAGAALSAARISPDAVTHLISVSCTGFGAPGLDIQLIRRLNLKPDVRRLHVGFMGCHAACNALAAARDFVLADPEAIVLVCSVELCTLHFAYGWNPETLVVNALFGDGAAAAIVGRPLPVANSHTGAWRLRATASQLLPESLSAMTWNIGDHGFSMTLSPEVPDLISRHLRPWCENWLAGHELTLSGIKNWAIHPGGPKVLTAAVEALGLDQSVLRCSREVLAAHGNMSSATILFLLQNLADAGASGPCVALGFGPGLMAEAMLLDR